MEKLRQLERVSDINEVNRKAMQLHLNEVHPSSQTRYKYMIYDPFKERMIHFGDMNYQDYTKHKDDRRRQNFKNRNRRFAHAPIYSPSYLSYYLLW